MYGKTTTSLLIVILTPLVYLVGELPILAAYSFFAVSGFCILYLFAADYNEKESGPGTRLLPGHYLLLLILVLQSPLTWLYFVLWTLLILATLGYSFFYVRGYENSDSLLGKLTTFILYCIMWVVVFFFVQRVFVIGTGLRGLQAILLRSGILFAGFLYIIIGVYRMIHKNKQQRRFTI